MLKDCPGQVNLTDDIFVFGQTKEEHHANLVRVIEILERNGLTGNGPKCELYKSELTFFGMRLSKDGIAPTEERCQALREAAAPTNAKEVQSFLGFVGYSARFIMKMADIVEPLKRLTHTGVPWRWTEVEANAFEQLKKSVATTCLAYFNKDWDT